MEDRERDQALMDGFTFGARLVRLAHDIDDQHPKHLTLLEEIAKRKATSLEGGAELLRKLPMASDEFAAQIEEEMPGHLAEERELARRIVEAYRRLMEEMTGGH